MMDKLTALIGSREITPKLLLELLQEVDLGECEILSFNSVVYCFTVVSGNVAYRVMRFEPHMTADYREFRPVLGQLDEFTHVGMYCMENGKGFVECFRNPATPRAATSLYMVRFEESTDKIKERIRELERDGKI